MSRKISKKFKWGLLIFIILWIIFAQSCVKFRISDTQAKTEFEQKGLHVSFINVKTGDGTLHYVKTGIDSLPTLFFIHGSPGSWDAFKGYMMDSALLRHFRIISVDRPGFGYSNFGSAVHLEEQTQMISKIIEKENNNKLLHLIGHSIGGPVIVQLAQDNPSAVASLTILAGSISPKDEPREYWRYLFAYSPLKFFMPGAFRPSNDEIVYFKKDLYRIDKGYGVLDMPVTFIHGDMDKFVTMKNVEYGKGKLKHNPHVKVIIIPGAGHFIPWEHYGLIREHLLTLATGVNQ